MGIVLIAESTVSNRGATERAGVSGSHEVVHQTVVASISTG